MRIGHQEGHPQKAALDRFLRGEAAAAERRAVALHLLTGCPECLAVTRPFWQMTEIFGGGLDVDPEPRRTRRSRRHSEVAPRTVQSA